MTRPIDIRHSDRIPIGHDVTIELRYLDGQLYGIEYEHPCKAGARLGYIPINQPDGKIRDGWDLEQQSPLTLTPSLLCRACGHHGFIRGGQWHPC